MYGDKLVEFAIFSDLKFQLIANNDLLQEDGRKIVITAASGQKIVNSLIELKVELSAPTAMQKNGGIFTYAKGSNEVKNNISIDKGKKIGSSKVVVSAKLDVSEKRKGEKADKITITGDNVTLVTYTILRNTRFLSSEAYNYISSYALPNAFINLEFQGLKDFDAVINKNRFEF